MIAVLLYQLSLIHRMQSINRDLSRVNFNAASIARDLQQEIDNAQDFRSRFLILQDYDYQKLWQETERSFLEDLERLEALELSAGERTEIERLANQWRSLQNVIQEQEEVLPSIFALPDTNSVKEERIQALRAVQDNMFDALTEHVEQLASQTRSAILNRVQQSTRTGEQAEWVSWSAAALALGLSLLVSVLIVRSISGPLGQLTRGTREIAKGRFSYRLNAQGSGELSQLAEDFNNMAEKLNELDQMKRDFVSHVSHELKSPLASMQETVRLLLEEVPGPLTEKQKRLLDLTYQSGKRLTAMIRNLLDMARMEAGVMEYEFEEEDLAELTRTAIAEFEPQLRGKNVQVKSELPQDRVRVECDGGCILQVVSNLLANAFKFSPEGSTIQVRLQLLDQIPAGVPTSFRPQLESRGDGAQEWLALLSISDSGPGIPDIQKLKIFERFHQIKEGQMSGAGAGLGLAISHSILEAHGGAIWVEDNLEGGSIFFVLLDMGQSPQRKSASGVPSRRLIVRK